MSDTLSSLRVEIGDEEIETGGIYGFLKMVTRTHDKYGGKIAVAWECAKGINFRYTIYPEYKRKPVVEAADASHELFKRSLEEQERRLKAMLRAIGIWQYGGVNCEADDVIGRLARVSASNGNRVAIYSGDSDLRQLVTEKVKVVAPQRRKPDVIYDPEKVMEKHGVIPQQLSDQKALAGDVSDNIPGVKGVGDVTAGKLLAVYHNVEGVLSAVNDIVAGEHPAAEDLWPVAQRFLPLIHEAQGNVRLYKQLTTIDGKARLAPIKPKPNKNTLRNHIIGYKFASMEHPTEFRELVELGRQNG
jgi:5'-3' exonuclease